ncbi:metal ABC transporter solute-binding protein, Zn/Mn family [Rivularia sp. UHCC 0363]|uniref:metal ABC transporter solute-binding protein, Zn/Mn family n=1 Tax=Rivularia sp. UHCC 0363 TaxID=3110244 RepID=UPI002B1F74AC|nr:zinc ABC transporter substrate-binding protein [Rivularia sp. UHCC 0363]MEA5594273.1 zinc ABC transporter substrate-binding protein [Rivularia sp. UHCC 0363]
MRQNKTNNNDEFMLEKLLLNKTLRIIFILFTVSFYGCNNSDNSNNTSSYTTTVANTTVNKNLPKVVATTSVLCDLTKQIAAKTINLTCLTPASINPKVYQPTPADQQAINQAKLIIFNGYNLEPGLEKFILASKNSAPKVPVAKIAVPVPLMITQNGKKVADPYIWHNAKNAVKMVEVININLARTLPENAKTYQSNTQKITNQISQLDSWIKTRIGTIPSGKRTLVTTNNAMAYYVRAYGLKLAGTLRFISPTEQISDVKVNLLAKTLEKTNVPTIFVQPTVSPQLIKSVAEKAQIKISERQLFAENLGLPGSDADTYQKMMTTNTRTIIEGLEGTYLIFDK